jgi:hypothetical protein
MAESPVLYVADDDDAKVLVLTGARFGGEGASACGVRSSVFRQPKRPFVFPPLLRARRVRDACFVGLR